MATRREKPASENYRSADFILQDEWKRKNVKAKGLETLGLASPTLKDAAMTALKEMEEIEALAKELNGNPWNSTAYMESAELLARLKDTFRLMNGNFVFNVAAQPSDATSIVG